MNQQIRPGYAGEKSGVVIDSMTAPTMGSGSINVLATPAMIALMEAAAVAAVDSHLPEGQASVGVGLDVRHVAATPPGVEVRARAEVTAVDGRKVTLDIKAWDEMELIGDGTHTRLIIDVERFVERVRAKAPRSM